MNIEMRLLIILGMLHLAALTKAQCVESNFLLQGGQASIPAACPLQPLEFSNLSKNSFRYEWDFCAGDLNSDPSGTIVTTLTEVQTFDAIKIVKESDSQYYGFIVRQGSGALFRLSYGPDLSSVPSVENLGQLGLSGSSDIEFIQDQGIWYALVASGSNLIRLKFSGGLGGASGTITSTNLGQFGGVLNAVRGLALVKEQSNFFVLATSSTLNTLTVIRFNGSMEGSVTTAVIAVPGSAQLMAINAFRECDAWFAVMTSVGNSKVIKARLGEDLLDTQGFQFLTQTGVSIQSYGMDVLIENSQYYVFLATIGNPGTLFQLDYGNSIWQNIPIVKNKGSLSGLAGCVAMDFQVNDSQVLGFVGNRSNYQLHRISYPNNCTANVASATIAEPSGVLYEDLGDYSVELKAFDENGNFSSSSQTVHISSAPVVNFNSDENCIGGTTLFHDTSIPGKAPIVSWAWDFNGEAVSDLQHPEHAFSQIGETEVSLAVTDSRGCMRSFEKMIKIYSDQDIVPEFSFPELFCSNALVVFNDESSFVEDEIVSWRWAFNNGEGLSNNQNPSFTFSTSGLNEIELTVTGKSGCSFSTTKNVETLPSPALALFLDENYCDGKVIHYHASSDGAVKSFQWDLGDGNYKAGKEVDHTYAGPGVYNVWLTGESLNGCISGRSQEITIRPLPTPYFSIEPPPQSCSGRPTTFTDETSNAFGRIAEWIWDFNDEVNPVGSDQQNPSHTFNDSGDYYVSLSVVTEYGCSGSAEKLITIAPSPSTVFTHSTACEDLPVSFSPPADNSIAYWYWEIGTAYYYAPTPSHTFMAPGDYPLYAEFVGTNGCVSEISKTIHVPQPLIPDFSFMKNCVGQEALFTDLTAGSDPVASREWDFGNGESSSSSPASHVFTQIGAPTVVLKVTGQSGCAYQVARQVEIIPPPLAAFTASPQSGAYPLDVTFTNSSSQATGFHWEFIDGTGTTSEEESPNYRFPGPGLFDVRLTAFNTQQCEDDFTQTITTFAPLPDADVEMINVVPNPDGSARLIVTINNKGNTILKSLPLTVDFGGKVSLQQIVEETILPATRVNFVFTTSILDAETLRYLCVSLNLDHDLNPTGNRMCKQFENRLFVFPAYPNPARDQLEIEWISESNINVHVSLTDGLGRQVFSRALPSVQGLNSHWLSLDGLGNGIYFLAIDDGSTRTSQRIVVVNAP